MKRRESVGFAHLNPDWLDQARNAGYTLHINLLLGGERNFYTLLTNKKRGQETGYQRYYESLPGILEGLQEVSWKYAVDHEIIRKTQRGPIIYELPHVRVLERVLAQEVTKLNRARGASLVSKNKIIVPPSDYSPSAFLYKEVNSKMHTIPGDEAETVIDALENLAQKLS